MKLNSIYIDEKIYARESFDTLDETTANVFKSAIINNVSVKYKTENSVEKAEGNPTEVGLVSYVITNKNYKSHRQSKLVATLPFNSEYKYMATLYEVEDNKYRVYIKGGPDVLMKMSTKVYSAQKSNDLTEDRKNNISRVQEDFAEGQQRTLVIGQLDVDANTFKTLAEKYKNELTKSFFEELIGNKIEIIALVGIIDPHRKEVPDAIKQCKSAKVLVRMVTGDYIKTAIAIAKEIKILSESEANESMARVHSNEEKARSGASSQFDVEDFSKNIYSMEGPEFRVLCGGMVEQVEGVGAEKVTKRFLKNPDLFRKVTKNLRVIARASPDDKYLLVLGLKETGSIVAVTGDGTNDAPALNCADVGFSMGIRGTDIAKAVSDIVLQDDSFQSIITAIKYGRNVYDCIRKFLQFQLTTNCVAVFMTLLGGVILNDAPLNAIQMLWVNLIMDSFASLALATESPKDILLTRKPYPKTDNIITPYMMINVVTQSIYQIIILTVVIFYGDWFFEVPSDRELSHYEWNDENGFHFTVFFNIFVFLQVFNSINARKLGKAEKNVFSGIMDNFLYIFVQLFIIFGQVLMVQVGGRALRTRPLTGIQHLWCIVISASCIVLGFIVKLLPYGDEEEEVSTSWLKSVKSVKARRNTNKTIPIQTKKK
jgi:magnesium-transporting ATPase (P-type)